MRKRGREEQVGCGFISTPERNITKKDVKDGRKFCYQYSYHENNFYKIKTHQAAKGLWDKSISPRLRENPRL